MPRGSSAVFVATVTFFVGFAIAASGVLVLMSHKGLGLALMGGGFAVVLLGTWVSTLKRRGGS